jgi:hypothetical protein
VLEKVSLFGTRLFVGTKDYEQVVDEKWCRSGDNDASAGHCSLRLHSCSLLLPLVLLSIVDSFVF